MLAYKSNLFKFVVSLNETMDLTTAQYIVNNYRRFLTATESAALLHIRRNSANTTLRHHIYQTPEAPEIQAILADDPEESIRKIANRILNTYPDRIFLNICPRCAQLARTHFARQCPYCYYQWHQQTVATFQLKGTFHLRSKSFFLFGELISGNLNKGNYLDLTTLMLNYQPEITSWEFMLNKSSNNVHEDIAFPVDEVHPEERAWLQEMAAASHKIRIITEKRV
ncbi:hypothetical protein ACDQ55_14275 [Chitinophaga sp. 30R24]|uniref:hypothetical protein n=1 Tax=Chitinophaga sp. 30R24 TaxID=3248838 RepID=UPI003B8F4347